MSIVLNLVISGIPSILYSTISCNSLVNIVLNLVISGIPSIQTQEKHYTQQTLVLNLVISGIPSIQ